MSSTRERLRSDRAVSWAFDKKKSALHNGSDFIDVSCSRRIVNTPHHLPPGSATILYETDLAFHYFKASYRIVNTPHHLLPGSATILYETDSAFHYFKFVYLTCKCILKPIWYIVKCTIVNLNSESESSMTTLSIVSLLLHRHKIELS